MTRVMEQKFETGWKESQFRLGKVLLVWGHRGNVYVSSIDKKKIGVDSKTFSLAQGKALVLLLLLLLLFNRNAFHDCMKGIESIY